ncbi:hypothetical protein, partial [Pseudomonas sichuanensis]|uniref:hypothetical protein n=1 Tax=Pseudomonas sichuanensis TaxID=2213015 RepID=UPI0036E25A03
KADSDEITGVTGPKQMWELACQRCAARAALDLIGAANLRSCPGASNTQRNVLQNHPKKIHSTQADTFPHLDWQQE